MNMGIPILPFVHFFAFLIYVYLGVLIFSKGRRTLLNRVASAFLFCFAIWSLCMTLITNPELPEKYVTIFYNIAGLGYGAFASFYIWLILIFTEKKKIYNSVFFKIIIFFTALLAIHFQWNGNLLGSFFLTKFGWFYTWSKTWGTLYFVIYYGSFVVAGIILSFLFEKNTKAQIKKRQARAIYSSSIITLILGSTFNLILPLAGISSVPLLADVSVLILAFGIVYAILRFQFLNIIPRLAINSIISSISDIIFILDLNGNIINVNSAALELLGYDSGEELNSKPVSTVFEEEKFQEIIIERTLNGKDLRNYYFVLKTKNDKGISVILSCSSLRDAQGSLLGILCIAQDITRLERTEKELKKNEALLKQTQRIANIGSFEWDFRNNTILASEEFISIYGLPDDTPREENIHDLVKKCINPDDREGYEKYLDKVLFKHIIDPIEYRIVLPNGLSRDIWADGEFVYDKNGTPIKMIGSIQDITERRIAFETLKESERKYRTIFERANDGIIILNEIGKVLDVNDQVVKIFGFPKDDIIDKHFTKLDFFGVNVPGLIKDFHKLLNLPEGENTQFELEARNSDGRKIFIEASPTLIRRNNKVEKIQIMVRDITERKEAEAIVQKTFESLRREREVSEEERNKTLAIISNLIDPIIVLDKENKIILINPATRAILGLTDKDLGKEVSSENNHSINNFKNIIKKEYKVSIKEGLKDDENVKEEFTLEYRGEELTFKVSTAKVIDNKGEYLGVMKLFYNMTQEKMVEKLKSEFITVAAHQFRTPLSATKWVIKMVLDGDAGGLTQEQQRFLLQGYRSNERVIKLVNDMLNASRIEEGRFGYVFKKEDLHEIVKAAQKHLSELATEKGIDIKVDIPIGLPSIDVDKEKILLVFQGLLDNAIKYTQKNGNILIKAEQEVDKVKIKIKDSGVGIPIKEQSKVFSKFFRATNVVRLETDGSGLGLFIAKNIIEKHGGKITYKSEEGKGTEFNFTLLIEQPAQ